MTIDIGLISGTINAITGAKELIKSAISTRDALAQAPELLQVNELLLKAQESLLTYSARLLQLQSEQFESAQKIRELTEAMAEKSRYTLFEITPGALVYRADEMPRTSATGEPLEPEPEHYLCQGCFKQGAQIVLRFLGPKGNPVFLKCPKCGDQIDLR